MIYIEVTDVKDDKSFNIMFKVRSDNKSEYIQQLTAVLDQLYETDEKCFTSAVCRSKFGQMVMAR